LSFKVQELLKILVGNFTVLKRLKEAKRDMPACQASLLFTETFFGLPMHHRR